MRAAIIGGTFNPVHLGHVFLAHEIRYEFGYDVILFVPANKPAHKGEVVGASVEQRMHMLEIATSDCPGFIVDDCEIIRRGVSYTIDTLADVSRKYDLSGKPGLVIGDDLVAGFHLWRRAGEIPDFADIIVAHRLCDTPVSFDVPHSYCNNLRLPVASSGIRDRIREGRPVEGLVPDGVLRYIRRWGLYAPAQAPEAPS